MNDTSIKSILLFFYFAFLDTQKAKEFSVDAFQVFKQRLAKHPQSPDQALVIATHQIWKKHQHEFVKTQPHLQMDPNIILPLTIDLNAWIEFQRQTPDNQLLVMIWGKILKISDEDISAVLKIPIGTIRYRLNQALKNLGSHIHLKNKLSLVQS